MKPHMKILTVLFALLLSGCTKYIDDEPYYEEVQYVPLLMTYDEMKASVKANTARAIREPGKIVLYNHYILIVEKYRGFHLINNTDPAAPVNMAFVSIPGCIDVAVKNNMVYADNAVDLVTLNMTDPSTIYEVARIPSVFPELNPPGQDYIPYWFNKENRPANTIIVGWKKKEDVL